MEERDGGRLIAVAVIVDKYKTRLATISVPDGREEKMKRDVSWFGGVVIALVLGAFASPAAAKNLSQSIRIPSFPATPVSGTGAGGACASAGYNATCPSGTCACYSIPNGNVTTGAIAGTGTADVELTVDEGNATTSVSPGTVTTCVPVYGLITTSTTRGKGRNRRAVTDVFNISGALCRGLPGRGEELSGGFGIFSSDDVPPRSGYGTVKSNRFRKDGMQMKFEGPVTQ